MTESGGTRVLAIRARAYNSVAVGGPEEAGAVRPLVVLGSDAMSQARCTLKVQGLDCPVEVDALNAALKGRPGCPRSAST